MEYGPSDSSGTDDDLPPSHQNRSARGGLARNGRHIVGGHAYPRVQHNIEAKIHQLEQEAYSSVLRAFKAQSDAITWEKEGLITELRKELRVSDDEHRDLLSKVNTDEVIRGIREWRLSGGPQSFCHNSVPSSHDAIPSPNLSASRKRHKTSQAIPPLPLCFPSPSLHSQSISAPMQAASAARRGTPGLKGKKPKLGQSLPAAYSTGTIGRGQFLGRSLGVIPSAHLAETVQNDPFIGRKVMTRWPADNNFYEAVITDFNAMKGLHLLTYDADTPNETWEWVNLDEISAEDIRWEGDDSYITCKSGRGGLGRGAKKPRGAATFGRGRGFFRNQPKKDVPLSQNGMNRSSMEDIQILNTAVLIKEVEMAVIDAAHPDLLEIDKAKKSLKEHEQSLLDAIARLSYVSDCESEDGDHHLSNGQSTERDQSWRNQQFNGNQHPANYDDTVAATDKASFDEGDRMLSGE